MRDFKEWTGNERLASLKKTKAAIAAGVIPPPTKCNRCGKTTGRIDYHNHDYSDPIKYLEQICQGCHIRLHRLENQQIAANTGNTEIIKTTPKIPVTKATTGEKPTVASQIEKNASATSSDLNSWLEKGMKLSLEDLKVHIRSTPTGVKPLKALRGLGIVFAGGFTKEYNCKGYPQTVGLARNRQKFDAVVEQVRFHERNGETLKVKGVQLSEKLESNYNYNK